MDQSLKVEIDLLVSLAALGVEGANSERPHHKSYRANLLRLLSRSGLPFSIFGNIDFTGLKFETGGFNGVNLDGARLSGAEFAWQIPFKGSCASELLLSKAKAVSANFNGSKFYDSWFEEADLNSATFDGATLIGDWNVYDYGYGWYDVEESYVPSFIDRARAKLNSLIKALGFEWSDTGNDDTETLAREDFASGQKTNRSASFVQAELKSATFRGAIIGGVSFKSANLQEANFSTAIFNFDNEFDEADLSNADFRLDASSFGHLPKTTFTKAIFSGTVLDGIDFGDNQTLTREQLSVACTCTDVFPRLKGKAIAVPRCTERRACGAGFGGSFGDKKR